MEFPEFMEKEGSKDKTSSLKKKKIRKRFVVIIRTLSANGNPTLRINYF